MRRPSMRRYNPQEFSPSDTGANDDASLLAAAAEVGTTVFHPVGVGALRVVDASVMPDSPPATPTLPP